MTGKLVAHYEIADRLGEGGSGVVYRGRDLRLDRPVAIKVLADELRNDELAWGRLLREARLASQLTHAHIGAIYDLGEENECAYIVMEYVAGLPLSDLIPEGGLPHEQVRRYGMQIVDALSYAHEQGVIHGDLKGSNVLVTSEGNTKLLDFGLGRRIPRSGMAEVTSSCLPLAEAGATAGTLPYLAPEVLRGHPSSTQSDVWALGVLLYQMATGELPFQGGTPFELSLEILVGAPQKLPQVAEPLRSVLYHCLEKDPAARSTQARDVLTGLSAHAPAVVPPAFSVAAPPPPARGLARAATQRWRKWLAIGGVAALVLLTLLLVGQAQMARNSAAKHPEAKTLKGSGTGNPDVKVWVNTRSGTYHCPGTTWFGKTQEGEFMTQKEAQHEGYRPAANHACL